MPKSKQKSKPTHSKKPQPGKSSSPPKEILLDECFLLCASWVGCDSTECQDDADRRRRRALMALAMALESAIYLVLDDKGEIASFYRQKYEFLSRDVREILVDWLNKHSINRKPAKINPKATTTCNLKPGKLDPLLCQLAVACRGQAPIWTLDSDFWCAMQFHREIKPTCPEEAMLSVK
jgi:hypothetical protein